MLWRFKKKFLNRSQWPYMDPTATSLSSIVSPPLCFKHWLPFSSLNASCSLLFMFHLAYILFRRSHHRPVIWLSKFSLQNYTQKPCPTSLTRPFLIYYTSWHHISLPRSSFHNSNFTLMYMHLVFKKYLQISESFSPGV